jgi:succinate dehydrogenase/fumarate reductase flavoprotein subunit
MQVERVETDVLVLGGGTAGHRAAIAAHEKGQKVAMIYMGSGASPFVIAFNVPLGDVDPRDTPEVYYQDVLRGGYYLNETSLVRALVTDTEMALRELEGIGVEFARKGSGYAQRHLSGSTYPRSVYQEGGTGRAVLRHLQQHCQELGIQVWSSWKIISLLQDGDEVVGALAVKPGTGELLAVKAKSVVVGMGGIGRIYQDSTYPFDIGADAYSLAYKAGASLIDMEFVQFEPTVVVYPEGCKGMEMPTAMLGDGAPMYNCLGERFMFKYNPEHGEKRIEKARMALCIQKEIDEGRGFPDGTVLFDTTALNSDLLEGYIHHCKRLRASGLEPSKEAPRVRPAAHSHMGGVYIDHNGWSGVPGLFACGESAGGVHGASRLAGNSGSDTLVFGARAGRGAAAAANGVTTYNRNWDAIIEKSLQPLRESLGQHGEATPEDIKDSLRKTMFNYAGLYRKEAGLLKGKEELESLEKEIIAGLRTTNLKEAIAALEAENMTLVARMIMNSALSRKESRGAHQRLDIPHLDEEQGKTHVAIQKGKNGAFEINRIKIN